MLRPSLGRAVIALAALAGAALGTTFHATSSPAQGNTPTSAPAGTVIYTTSDTCPSGFTDASFVSGRLVVGTDVAANVGAASGNAMLPDEAPTHRHDVTLGVNVGGRRLQDWCCSIANERNVGVAGGSNSSGLTTSQHSGAPLHQLRACRKS